jgi:hypothetical protein
VDEAIAELDQAVTAFENKTGRLPSNVNTLIAVGLLPGIPLDPDGKPYKYMPDGRFELRDPDKFPFVERGLPAGYKPPPPKLPQSN